MTTGRGRTISYLSSCSSFSSLFGVSFKPPFLARGHPDKLGMVGDGEITRRKSTDEVHSVFTAKTGQHA